MVVRLWVPLIHSLRARNWNCAISGCALTASRVANSVGTSTPLSAGRVCVLVMVFLLCVSVVHDDGTEVTSATFPRTSLGPRMTAGLRKAMELFWALAMAPWPSPGSRES